MWPCRDPRAAASPRCSPSSACSIRPPAGKYLLNGKPVENLSFGDRSRIRNQEIGFIFQSFNLIGDLTVEENVELPLTYRAGMPSAERKKRVKEALERVNMAHRMRHYPAQLSGGQQQRVAVARALAGSPSILLADEPTGNLDSKNGEAVMHLLADLHREGSTICMVTHDPRFAKHAEREVHLFDGKVVSEDELKKLEPKKWRRRNAMLQNSLAGLRYALRQLRRAPGFAFTVVLTLALSVGVATAVFCVIDAVILRPLPFANPDRIVAIDSHSRSGYTATGIVAGVSGRTRAGARLHGFGRLYQLTIKSRWRLRPVARCLLGQRERERTTSSRYLAFSRCWGARFCPASRKKARTILPC